MPTYNLPNAVPDQLCPELAALWYNSSVVMGDVHNVTHIAKLINIFERTRPWFGKVRREYSLHPVIKRFISNNELTQYLKDWRELVLEWPHVSNDGTQLAYTQSEEKGMRGLFTLTSLSKFIRRHAPTIPDHVLRDFCALNDETQGTYKHLTTTEQFVWAVENGPKSCMQFGDGSGEGDDMPPEGMHPYDVYKPEHGWGMVVRMAGNMVMGRCLTHDTTYVRSYRRCPNDGYSHSDTALEAYLVDKGYEKRSQWSAGTKIAAIGIDYDERYVMPYIDGDLRHLELHCRDGREEFVLSRYGCYEADRTDGEVSGDNRESCDSCGEMYDPDEMNHAGESDDSRVCDSCLSEHYVYAYGYRGRRYYAPYDTCVYSECADEHYVAEYLDHNGIEICTDNDGNSDYCDRDDCWYCDESEMFYTNDVPHVTDDATELKYHLDHIPSHLELNADGELVAVPETTATT